MPWTYLWQNFLTNQEIIDFIIQYVENIQKSSYKKICIEIWPWKWAITNKLINMFDSMILLEKDLSFKQKLDSILNGKWEIIWWDVLDLDLDKIINSFKWNDCFVLWNIPYYITSPIFRKFFVNHNYFQSWLFLVQNEVWEKLATNSNKRSYLWWLINYNYEVSKLLNVWPDSFTPPPSVDSCLISFVKKPLSESIDFDKMLILLDNISGFKRKTLWKIWKILQKKTNGVWYKLVIKWNVFVLNDYLSKLRLEDLSWDHLWSILWDK